MKVIEAHKTRHLVLRLDRGDELPTALVRALEDAGVRSGWMSGFGTLDAAELALFDARQRTYAKARKFDHGGDVVSLHGNVSQLDGSTCVRLFATLSRETEAGLVIVAGELMSGRAFAVEMHVTVIEDVTLARVADERTGQLALVRASTSPGIEIRPRTTTDDAPPARTSSPRSGADQTLPSIVEMARLAMGNEAPQPMAPQRMAMGADGPQPMAPQPMVPQRVVMAESPPGLGPQPLAPPKREKPRDEFAESYPEVGDLATHFHFGECKIISSDGDKIRLQQIKDLRVREVALSALRTELVSEDPTTHQRHFRLLRKN